jgi:hypothetical protein
MRRNERERIARRNAYWGSTNVGYWRPTTISPEDYLATVKGHPPISQMLEYLSNNPRDWTEDGEEFEFASSKEGICEKCNVRAMNIHPSLELKSTTKSAFNGLEVQFSKFIAEQFTAGKAPITLTPNLHREFVYQSWVEAAHLDHIPRECVDEPGIAGIQAHAELENGVITLALSLRAIDGSHRAALAYREGRPFTVFLLTPLETLQSTFAIDNKKNPFFLREYTKEADVLLTQMARGEIKP